MKTTTRDKSIKKSKVEIKLKKIYRNIKRETQSKILNETEAGCKVCWVYKSKIDPKSSIVHHHCKAKTRIKLKEMLRNAMDAGTARSYEVKRKPDEGFTSSRLLMAYLQQAKAAGILTLMGHS